MRMPVFLKKNATWLIGLIVILAVILVLILLLRPRAPKPWITPRLRCRLGARIDHAAPAAGAVRQRTGGDARLADVSSQLGG